MKYTAYKRGIFRQSTMKVVNYHIERHTEINNNLGLEPALCKANLIFVTDF